MYLAHVQRLDHGALLPRPDRRVERVDRDGAVEPDPDDLYKVGTLVSVVRHLKSASGMHHLICQGEQRFRALDFVPNLPFLAARFDIMRDVERKGPKIEALATVLRQQAAEAIELLPQAPSELNAVLRGVESPSLLSDLIAGLLDIKPEEKQQILEQVDVEDRLSKLTGLVAHRLEVLKLSKQISDQTQEKIDDRQREYVLREQLATIRKELGEDDDDGADGDVLVQRVRWTGLMSGGTAVFDSTSLLTSAPVHPGTHTLRFIVDPRDLIAESDETDNVFEMTATWGVGPVPELEPAPESTPPSREDRFLPNLSAFRPFGWDAAITARAEV